MGAPDRDIAQAKDFIVPPGYQRHWPEATLLYRLSHNDRLYALSPDTAPLQIRESKIYETRLMPIPVRASDRPGLLDTRSDGRLSGTKITLLQSM
jgi:hypothetical protein